MSEMLFDYVSHVDLHARTISNAAGGGGAGDQRGACRQGARSGGGRGLLHHRRGGAAGRQPGAVRAAVPRAVLCYRAPAHAGPASAARLI